MMHIKRILIHHTNTRLRRFVAPCSIAIIFLMLTAAAGQQEILISGKTINTTERWSGIVDIEGDVIVEKNGRLVIDAGTLIRFRPNTDVSRSGRDKTRSELMIKGVLIARGDREHKIRFTSLSESPRMQDWYGISISNQANPSILEYVIVEYGYNGLVVKKGNPQISNSQFQFNFNAGMSIELGSAARITGNIISENGYAGVICKSAARPVLSDNMITQNQIGLISMGTAQPNLGWLTEDENYNIGRNGLFDNREFNLHNHSGKEILAENNSWGATERDQIAEMVYDSEDAPQYGKVDYNPLLGSINLEEKLLLSQNTNSGQGGSPTEQNTAIGPAGPFPSNRSGSPFSQNQQGIQSYNPSNPDTSVRGQASVPDTGMPELPLALNTMERQVPQKVKPAETLEPEVDYSQVFLDAFLDERRTVTKKVAPVVHERRRGLGARGKVMVRVIVGMNGEVESASVLRGLHPYFDNLALEAARQFEFKPGTIKGNPVRFSTTLFFEF